MSKNKNLDSWATFFKCFNRIHESMECQMKKEGHPSLEIYDVLWTLEQAENHSLRLSDLSDKVFIARYNVTRICQKLEKENLIERKQCPMDKRGAWAMLTKKGLETRAKMWKTYSQLIKEKYSENLSQADHENMIKILSKLYTVNKIE